MVRPSVLSQGYGTFGFCSMTATRDALAEGLAILERVL